MEKNKIRECPSVYTEGILHLSDWEELSEEMTLNWDLNFKE